MSKAIVARIVSRPGEIRWAAFTFGQSSSKPIERNLPLLADLRAKALDMLSGCPKLIHPWAWIATGSAVHGADEAGVRVRSVGARMSATVIFADFTTKTWHKPQTLEEMATELAEQFNKMAEDGTEVIAIPYNGEGIDGMPYEAPPTDCA